MTLDPDAQAFADRLRQIERLLRDNGCAGWAADVGGCAARVERRDAYGVRRFLSLLGGMGSLNDLVLSRDGTPLRDENDRLRALIDEASTIGWTLWREPEPAQPEPAAAPTEAAAPVKPTAPPSAAPYLLMGLAAPLTFAAAMIFRMAFLPARDRPAPLAFSPGHPLAVICLVMAAAALALWIAAWVLLRRSRR
jgi:hypothetical protein